jgi:hypothetical protein
MSCYENILEVLRKSPPDLPTLHLLAPFLASAFLRIPPPARGPMAFKRFWDDTYKGSNISFSAGDAQSYPPKIRECLKAFHEVFGGDPPTGITFGSSQTTTVDIPFSLSCSRGTYNRYSALAFYHQDRSLFAFFPRRDFPLIQGEDNRCT